VAIERLVAGQSFHKAVQSASLTGLAGARVPRRPVAAGPGRSRARGRGRRGGRRRARLMSTPAITADAVRVRARDYLGDAGATDPAVSPVYASLAGLPPLLIQAGSHDVLLDDAIRLAARAYDDVAVTLDVVPGVPHVFQAFAAILDEGEAALTRAGAFLRPHRHSRCRKRGTAAVSDAQDLRSRGHGTSRARSVSLFQAIAGIAF
jgi:acetyl esterase/lipase